MGPEFDDRFRLLVKNILDLIKILNILLIAQKVFVDLKPLAPVNLNNPVLHKTAGYAALICFLH